MGKMREKRADAEAVLRKPLRPDDPGLEVVAEQPTATVVQSVRMRADLARRLFAEAARRGVAPSQLMRELIEAGLDDTEKAAVVNLADVHRAIDQIAKSA
jgi:predicted DNA-binding protein